jgi:sortase A
VALRRYVERTLLIIGLVLMAIYAAAWLDRQVSAHFALQEFETPQPQQSPSIRNEDFVLWSPQRIRAFKESLVGRQPPLAVLRIPKLRLEAPVFDGTDELTLNRGIGRIRGTAQLGHPGNIGLAGHRDGFFRGLKDIAPGDVIELTIPGRSDRYVVTDIQITTPEDVSVLRPTAGTSLTLVTCYPFYFVGSAPQRYIVRASISDQETP